MILEHLFGYCCITWFEMKMSRIQVQAIAPCHSPRRDSRLTILRLYVGMLLRSLRALSAVPAVLAASGVHGYVHCAPKKEQSQASAGAMAPLDPLGSWHGATAGPRIQVAASQTALAMLPRVTDRDLCIQNALRILSFQTWCIERGAERATLDAARVLPVFLPSLRGLAPQVLRDSINQVIRLGLVAHPSETPSLVETVTSHSTVCTCASPPPAASNGF